MKQFSLLAAACLWCTGSTDPMTHPITVLEPHPPLATLAAPAPTLLAQTPTVPALELLTSGAQPRQIFRFTPTLGAQQRMVLVMQADTLATMGEQTLPTLTLPAITMTVDTTVTDVAADGAYTGQFVYQDLSVGESELPPNFIAALREQLQALDGLAGEFRFDAQGNLQDFDLTLPETSNPLVQQLAQQLSDTLKQISNPFPAEAIGLGAQWRVPQTVAVNGLEFTQLSTYELVAVQGDRLTLQFESEQSGAGNLGGFPGVVEGFEPEIESLKSAGSGELTLDLGQLLPIALQMEATTDMTLIVNAPGRPEPLKINMTIEMVMELDGGS
ncbi:MAG: hypothetical protein AAGG51_28720 [Cyanobacteria bacterium P01_G01_bin.54]